MSWRRDSIGDLWDDFKEAVRSLFDVSDALDVARDYHRERSNDPDWDYYNSKDVRIEIPLLWGTF